MTSVVTDQSRRLAELARKRGDDARRRATDAIRRLDRAGTAVTFAAVAEAASVSRAWLYRAPEIRSEIERLRAKPSGSRLPSAQRSSVESYQRRIEALLEANHALRDENRRLNECLAGILGEARDPRQRHVTDSKSLASQAPRQTRSR